MLFLIFYCFFSFFKESVLRCIWILTCFFFEFTFDFPMLVLFQRSLRLGRFARWRHMVTSGIPSILQVSLFCQDGHTSRGLPGVNGARPREFVSARLWVVREPTPFTIKKLFECWRMLLYYMDQLENTFFHQFKEALFECNYCITVREVAEGYTGLIVFVFSYLLMLRSEIVRSIRHYFLTEIRSSICSWRKPYGSIIPLTFRLGPRPISKIFGIDGFLSWTDEVSKNRKCLIRGNLAYLLTTNNS